MVCFTKVTHFNTCVAFVLTDQEFLFQRIQVFRHKDELPSGRILAFMILHGQAFFYPPVSTFIIASTIVQLSMYSAAFYVISSAISMKMGYWTMTYLQVFQGQRSTLKKISPKRGPQRKYDNYCPLLTAAMRLEKEITRCSCLLFCWA